MPKNPFQTMLVNNETPALVMFYAPWCGYCQAYLPVLENIAEEFSGRLQVLKVNVDRNVAAALRYSIRLTPTFVVFHRGHVLWKKQGQVSKNELSGKILNLLKLEGVY